MKRRFIVVPAIVALLGAGTFMAYKTSRHDTTKPSSPASTQRQEQISARDKAITERLKSLSLRDEVALLLVVHTPGTDPEKIKQFLAAHTPGGLILMGDNIPRTIGELRNMAQSIEGEGNFPPLLAIDEEGGTVKRLAADTYPAGIDLAGMPVPETTAAFTERSRLLSHVGIPLNFGIVADVTDNPASFIYPRVLGTSPDTSSQRVAAAVHASKGMVYSTLKHFPGHGESTNDSHMTIPTTDISLEQWRQRDKPSFQAGIDAGAEFVMMGHLRYSAVDATPTSLSKKWYDVLRNDLGFKGIAITDDMLMLNNDPVYSDMASDAMQSLNAGATMLLLVTDHGTESTNIDLSALINSLAAEVNAGQISRTLVDSDARKVLEAQYDSRQFYK